MVHIDSNLSTIALLRRGLLGLAVLSLLATGLELAMDHHWKPGSQLVPWVSMLMVTAAIALLIWSASSRRSVRIAQILAIAVMLSAVFGVYAHVEANYEAAPLDFRYSDTWDNLSDAYRWWLALIHEVGPSPTLAPLALAYSAICVLLATLRHPAFDMDREPAG